MRRRATIWGAACNATMRKSEGDRGNRREDSVLLGTSVQDVGCKIESMKNPTPTKTTKHKITHPPSQTPTNKPPPLPPIRGGSQKKKKGHKRVNGVGSCLRGKGIPWASHREQRKIWIRQGAASLVSKGTCGDKGLAYGRQGENNQQRRKKRRSLELTFPCCKGGLYSCEGYGLKIIQEPYLL